MAIIQPRNNLLPNTAGEGIKNQESNARIIPSANRSTISSIVYFSQAIRASQLGMENELIIRGRTINAAELKRINDVIGLTGIEAAHSFRRSYAGFGIGVGTMVTKNKSAGFFSTNWRKSSW
jgi:hypothetical protein